MKHYEITLDFSRTVSGTNFSLPPITRSLNEIRTSNFQSKDCQCLPLVSRLRHSFKTVRMFRIQWIFNCVSCFVSSPIRPIYVTKLMIRSLPLRRRCQSFRTLRFSFPWFDFSWFGGAAGRRTNNSKLKKSAGDGRPLSGRRHYFPSNDTAAFDSFRFVSTSACLSQRSPVWHINEMKDDIRRSHVVTRTSPFTAQTPGHRSI